MHKILDVTINSEQLYLYHPTQAGRVVRRPHLGPDQRLEADQPETGPLQQGWRLQGQRQGEGKGTVQQNNEQRHNNSGQRSRRRWQQKAETEKAKVRQKVRR